jgi:hypothetical protein
MIKYFIINDKNPFGVQNNSKEYKKSKIWYIIYYNEKKEIHR